MIEKTQKILLSWTAPEFVYHAKTRGWFWALGIITTGVFGAAILIENYFFALLVPLVAFLIYAQTQKRPRQITIELTDKTINVGGHLSFDYKEIVSFWIFDEPEIRALSLKTKKLLHPMVSVLLGNQKTETIKETLKNFVPEKKHEEQLADAIARKLKF